MTKTQTADLQAKEAKIGDRDVHLLSSSLKGRRIALCVGGGIAATEAPKIARALRRLGAEVEAYVTENALKFIGEASLEWATSRSVTRNPTGQAEHVSTHDLVFVACATADLMAKSAHGICSDGVSTLIQSALGAGIPVLFAPTMHESLANSPFIQKNFETLQNSSNVYLLSPRNEEAKLKSRFAPDIADEASHFYNNIRMDKLFRSKKVLVTAGGTRVPIDAVRALSNLSTGTLGQFVVAELYRWGFKVDLALAQAQSEYPTYDFLQVYSLKELHSMAAFLNSVESTNYLGLFMLAAISDYEPIDLDPNSKIASKNENLILHLKRTPKLLALENLSRIPFRMACKLTADDSPSSRESVAALWAQCRPNLIFWNTVNEAFGESGSKGHLWDTSSELTAASPCHSKLEAARESVKRFREKMEEKH